MNLIDTILERIAANNRAGALDSLWFEGVCSGRREAYEDVLYILGFYDADREPRYREVSYEEPD